jgi:predicted transcriptional regulator
VLTAKDALAPASSDIPVSGETTAETPIRDVMAQLRGTVRALTVTEGGAAVGVITREAVLQRLLNPRGTIRD